MRSHSGWSLIVGLVAALSATSRADSVPAVVDDGLVAVAPGADWNELCLRRAVHRFWTGNRQGAIDVLRSRDATGSGSERADFLLAYALHVVGDRAGFLDEAMKWRTAPAESDVARWLTTLELIARAGGPADTASVPAAGGDEPVSVLLAAELLLRRDDPTSALRLLERSDLPGTTALLADALRVRAMDALGGDATVPLARLARRVPVLDLEHELVAAARVRMAALELADDGDYGSWLSPDDTGAARASRAEHVLGKAQIEAGDVGGGVARLETLVARDPDYESRRDVLRALGFVALERMDWDTAYARLSEVETDWLAEDARLAALRGDSTDAVVDLVWKAWLVRPMDGTLELDPSATERSIDRSLGELLTLSKDPPRHRLDPAAFVVAARDPRLPPSLGAPDSARWVTATELLRALEDARLDLRRGEDDFARASSELERRRHYYERGASRTSTELESIDALVARIDALIARSNDIVADLARVRDEEMRRIAVRTAGFLQTSRENLVFARALQHFYVEGPMRTRPEALPPGIPTPAEILVAEEDLVDTLERWFTTFAEIVPDLIDRSHDEIWLPRATDGVGALARSARDQRGTLRELLASIDASNREFTDTSLLAAHRERIERGREKVRTLDGLATDLRRNLVHDAIDDARRRLAEEQEGIAYALAAAAHERRASLGRELADAAQRDLAAALSREAADRYDAFLRVYPKSPARSEVRFRRADVLMLSARDGFHEKMTRFLGDSTEKPDGFDRAALAPFVDYGAALAEYQTLLTEDPDYAHVDAVLYHVGMILSDDGDPDATRHLTRLVVEFPESRYGQEAHLRLGDDLFLRKNFAACIPHYQSAANGPNPEHTAIALYKAGWAHYNRDEFDQGALSFRQLLDLHAATDDAKRSTDLEKEAEEYLVHCLARAGGAGAFASLFDAGTARPYERGLLTNLGHLLRRFSLFEEAAATDSLWIERYPAEPGALEAAERLVGTLARADLDAASRTARLRYAPLFLDDTAWFLANESDSMQAAGREFARTSYKAVALFHHHEAREKDSASDWRAALEHYALLTERWPEHEEAPTLHYYSGETAAALREYERSIRHFEIAAASDTASFRVDAAWHAIAVRDAWYESETAHPAELARGLVTAIDAFTAAHVSDPRCADLVWRRANIAYDHNWMPEALDGLAAFASGYPKDARALPAARLRAQILYETEDFDAAGSAYTTAFELARSAQDSTAAELEALVPHCAFRHAEQVAAADHGDSSRESGRLFEELAARWPAFEHADQALYLAGLGYDEAGMPADAVRSWSTLAAQHGESEYVRDARLKIAHTWESAERPESASLAYEQFADAFPEDEDAAPSMLRAIDLAVAADDPVRAESLRDGYLRRYPGDVDTAFEILEARAAREIAVVGPDRPISGLLAATAKQPSNVRRYLDLAETHPDKASRALLAQVQFHRGEEARGAYTRHRITLPLAPGIAEKKSLLENVLQEYRTCASLGVAPWNRAAAFRIGECLVAFGDALMESERPADLSGDDLLAYDEVLEEQSWDFFDKGELTWGEMLRQVGENEAGGEWVVKARQALWPRVAARFVHRPEVEYPLVAARAPEGS